MEVYFPEHGSEGTVWYKLQRRATYWAPYIPDAPLLGELRTWPNRKILQTKLLKTLTEEGKVQIREWGNETLPPPGTSDLGHPGEKLANYQFKRKFHAYELQAIPSSNVSVWTPHPYNPFGSQTLGSQTGSRQFPASSLNGNPYTMHSGPPGWYEPIASLVPFPESLSHQSLPQEQYALPGQYTSSGSYGGLPQIPMMNVTSWKYGYDYPSTAYATQPQEPISHVLGNTNGSYYVAYSSHESAVTMPPASVGTGWPTEEDSFQPVTPSAQQKRSLQTTIDSGADMTRTPSPPIVRSDWYKLQPS